MYPLPLFSREVSRKYPPYWIVGTVMRMIPDINLASRVIGFPLLRGFRFQATATFDFCFEPSAAAYLVLCEQRQHQHNMPMLTMSTPMLTMSTIGYIF